MTTEIAKEHVEYISATLETHAITYRTISRDLGLHVSKAKMVLSSYWNANKSRVAASFVATGTRHGNAIVRLFENEVDLNDKSKSEFDRIHTVHVYCLSLNTNAPSPADIAMEERKRQTDLSDLPKYYNLGIIKGPELKVGSLAAPSAPVSQPVTAPKAVPSKETKKSETAPSLVETPEKPKLVYQSRKTQAKPSAITSYVSRKSENITSSGKKAGPSTSGSQKRPSQEKPTYEYKSRKLDKSEPKERVVVSSMENDIETIDISAEPETVTKPAISQTELNDMFLDDFTDDDEKDNESKENGEDLDQPVVVEHPDNEVDESGPIENETDTVQAQSLPKNDIWHSISSGASAQETSTTKENSPPPETTVDEDGFFTSYKQSEPKPEPAKKPARAPPKIAKSNKKSDGKLKQTSVMSFFQKR